MAQRFHVTLEDDLDGSKGDETIRFGLDGTEYEIDLSSRNAKTFREAMAPYVAVARKARGNRRRTSATTRNSREESRAIREWAMQNGYELSTRGRVPMHIREAYHAAH